MSEDGLTVRYILAVFVLAFIDSNKFQGIDN